MIYKTHAIWSDFGRHVPNTYKCTYQFNLQHPGRPFRLLRIRRWCGFSSISSKRYVTRFFNVFMPTKKISIEAYEVFQNCSVFHTLSFFPCIFFFLCLFQMIYLVRYLHCISIIFASLALTSIFGSSQIFFKPGFLLISPMRFCSIYP